MNLAARLLPVTGQTGKQLTQPERGAATGDAGKAAEQEYPPGVPIEVRWIGCDAPGRPRVHPEQLPSRSRESFGDSDDT